MHEFDINSNFVVLYVIIERWGSAQKQWIRCELRLQSAAGINFVKIANCAEFFLFPAPPAWQTNDHLVLPGEERSIALWMGRSAIRLPRAGVKRNKGQ